MRATALVLAAGLLWIGSAVAVEPATRAAIRHGEFLVNYGGCNDCHTPGWDQHDGHAPREQLLTGGGEDFQGPWGTTYAPNLRLYMHELTLAQWITAARSLKTRPAMPWWTFRYLTDRDLADMYAYIRDLGPAGQPAQAWVPPGQPAPAPYLELVLPTRAATARSTRPVPQRTTPAAAAAAR